MPAATLDEFMALNDQLAALAAAGVPLDLGLPATGVDAAATLEKVNAVVARKVSRGASLDDALADDDVQLPSAYRCLVQLGLRSGRLDAALDSSRRVAETVEETRRRVRSALLYPLIVCGLAIVGLASFRIFLAPILQDAYAGLEVAPGRGLQAMLTLPGNAGAWLLFAGAAAGAFFASRVVHRSQSARTGGGLWRRAPGADAAMSHERWASFASSLSDLLKTETPLTEALRLAACASGDDNVRRAARGLADMLDQQSASPSNADHPAVGAFPPFLRWAILESEPSVDRPRALEMAASLYRSAAQRSVERVRVLTPMAACIFLGGGAALVYALALFLPVTELLTGIAAAKPGS